MRGPLAAWLIMWLLLEILLHHVWRHTLHLLELLWVLAHHLLRSRRHRIDVVRHVYHWYLLGLVARMLPLLGRCHHLVLRLTGHSLAPHLLLLLIAEIVEPLWLLWLLLKY